MTAPFNPSDPIKASNLSDARDAILRGDDDAALALYAAEVQKFPHDGMRRAEYGMLLWRRFEFDHGRRQFVQALDSQGLDLHTVQNIARRFFEIGRFGEAADALQGAERRLGTLDGTSLEQLAGCLERNNQMDLARECAERALRVDPASVRATRLLAHIDKREGRYQEAIERLRRRLASQADPWDWGLRYELAASLDRVGEFDEAWSELCLAKKQLRSQTEPHLQEAALVRRRQWELAREITAADLRSWRRPPPGDASHRRIALLAGFPRSGTTLLEQMIASSPECVDTDETGILSAQFISPIVWQAPSAFDALLEIRGFQEAQLVEGRNAYFRFTENFLGQAIGDRLLIEKDPLLVPDAAVPLRLFPQARLLMPLRDPRDVVVSFFFTMTPLNWVSAASTTIEETCRFYADCMRHWLLLRDRLQHPWLETRYEALVSDPEGETKQIAEFLSISWEPGMISEKKRAARRAIRTPTYDDVARPLYTRAIGRWKSYATWLEPAVDALKPYLDAFGYAL